MRIYIIVHIPWGDSGELVFPTLHMIQTKLFHNFNIEDKICLSGSGVDNHCIVHTTIIVDKTMKMKKKLFLLLVLSLSKGAISERHVKYWWFLELKQYKNDWIASRNSFVLKLARFFTRLYSE